MTTKYFSKVSSVNDDNDGEDNKNYEDNNKKDNKNVEEDNNDKND